MNKDEIFYLVTQKKKDLQEGNDKICEVAGTSSSNSENAGGESLNGSCFLS